MTKAAEHRECPAYRKKGIKGLIKGIHCWGKRVLVCIQKHPLMHHRVHWKSTHSLVIQSGRVLSLWGRIKKKTWYNWICELSVKVNWTGLGKWPFFVLIRELPFCYSEYVASHFVILFPNNRTRWTRTVIINGGAWINSMGYTIGSRFPQA